MGYPHSRFLLICASITFLWAGSTPRQIDIVSPVASKDAVTYRYSLRHALKHVRSVRHVYVVCKPTPQLESVVAQANMHFAGPGQKVILVDEASFPMNFENIRGFLRTYRPTEGLEGQPFNGQVAVPRVCKMVAQARTGKMVIVPYKGDKELLDSCRQPFKNETQPGEWVHRGIHKEGPKVFHPEDPEMDLGPYEVFDRTGWMLQQFLKLAAGEAIPGILEAYMVIDADTIFYKEYHPFPIDDTTGEQYNYVPGEGRDCGNPPYFMTSDRLAVGPQPSEYNVHVCSKSGRCRNLPVCPIAHQMIYRRDVLRGLFAHIEREVVSTLTPREAAYLDPAKRAALRWWEAILLVLPAWHTSPFSEYIMYFQYATTKHPHTVRLYDNGVMGNGVQVDIACGLFDAVNAGPKKEPKRFLNYCHDNKKSDGILYRSYHGFRNEITTPMFDVYRDFDLAWRSQHNKGQGQAGYRGRLVYE